MADETALEELLSRPTAATVAAMGALRGDLLVLGAGGKMGPTLCRLAVRAARDAGARLGVTAVARWTDARSRTRLEQEGIVCLSADLLDPAAVAALPDAANVIFMVGQKFGTTGDEPRTWAINAWLPGLVGERYTRARVVAFSTGNVYPLCDVRSTGPTESDPVGPVGEYAQSALARERVLEFCSRRHRTPLAILRLNYAVEPRYGVLRDIADRVREGRTVDLSMGYVNVIWQRDANAIALQALAKCRVPPFVLNVTGKPALSVRRLAARFGERFGVEPRFAGTEGETALLSNAGRMVAEFGPPEVSIDEMIVQVAAWIEQGGRSLSKPTHFEMREGRF